MTTSSLSIRGQRGRVGTVVNWGVNAPSKVRRPLTYLQSLHYLTLSPGWTKNMKDVKETPPWGEGSLHFLGACPLHGMHPAEAAGETAGPEAPRRQSVPWKGIDKYLNE